MTVRQLTVVSVACIASMLEPVQAEQVNVLWIGNSLTQAPLCGEGWMAVMFMCNDNSDETSVVLASYPVMAGATSLATHWSNQNGFNELDNPIVRRPDDPWQTESVDKYDFLVLQPYRPAGGSSEETALRNYADLALSKGTTPVIFGIWDQYSTYDEVVAMYMSVWDDYRGQGMLYAPLFDAYKIVVDDGHSAEYLFHAGDTWHHENEHGVYINMCTFYYLFTGHLPTDYPFSNMTSGWCGEASSVSSDADYLEAKTEEALDMYYDLGGTAARISRSVSRVSPAAGIGRAPHARPVFDVAGRLRQASPAAGAAVGQVPAPGTRILLRLDRQ